MAKKLSNIMLKTNVKAVMQLFKNYLNDINCIPIYQAFGLI